MEVEALRAEIGTSMLRYSMEEVLHSRVAAQRVGLDGSDSRFLSLLSLHGSLTPGRLAELTQLSTGTVTGVIDRLERAGFVRRDRDPADRRKVLVSPMLAAMAALAENCRGHGEHLDTVLQRRNASELRVIAAFFVELNRSGADGPDPR